MYYTYNLVNNPQRFFNQQLGFSKWAYHDDAFTRPEGIPLFQSDEVMVDDPIFACKFAEKPGYKHMLALARERGSLVIANTNNTTENEITQIHHNAIFDLAWLYDSYKIITVAGDNTARLLDLESGGVRIEQIFSGHTRSVKTVAVRQTDSSVFATGSRDGSIRLWDIRANSSANLIINSDRTIINSHCKNTPTSNKKKTYGSQYISPANSVTGLVFQNENVLISCGSGDGNIKVWDLRKTYHASKRIPAALHNLPYAGGSTKNGFSNILIDKWGLNLYANCLDNTIYCYNIGTYDHRPVMEYRGFENNSFYIKSVLSPCGLYLLSGSSDYNAYIWNLKHKYPIHELSGHLTEVTCVGWRKDYNPTFVTCSDDIACLLWQAGHKDSENKRKVGLIKSLNNGGAVKSSENNETTPKQSEMPDLKRPLVDQTNFQTKRRRLFNYVSDTDEALADILEPSEPPLSKRARLDDTTSPSNVFSPTSNLPNFVIDGSAPHLHFSPQKRQDKDWLTKLRVERKLMRNMQDLANETPTKVRKVEDASPRSTTKSGTKSQRSNRCNSPQSPILRFFRIANSSIMKDSSSKTTSSHNNHRKENLTAVPK